MGYTIHGFLGRNKEMEEKILPAFFHFQFIFQASARLQIQFCLFRLFQLVCMELVAGPIFFFLFSAFSAEGIP